MFDFLSNLTSSIISPKIGLDLLRGQIEKALGIPIQEYKVHVDLLNDKIFFVISVNNQQRQYPYDDSHGLSSMIKSIAQQKISSGDNVDYIIIAYTTEGSNATIYYRDAVGDKQFTSTNL